VSSTLPRREKKKTFQKKEGGGGKRNSGPLLQVRDLPPSSEENSKQVGRQGTQKEKSHRAEATSFFSRIGRGKREKTGGRNKKRGKKFLAFISRK